MKTKKVLRRHGVCAAILFLVLGITAPSLSAAPATPVTRGHINSINNSFRQNGIQNGYVNYDNKGRLELLGSYEDNRQVDLAFSLAQTVVGVRWVSPVTPENIKVKEWEQKISSLFSVRTPTETGGYPGSKDAPGPVQRKFGLVVGVGRFQNPKITTLQYTTRDARVYYDYLTDPKRGNFPRQNVVLLLDEQATRANIKAALDNIKSQAIDDDLVTIYFSSHGTPPDKFGGVHVVTYDTKVEPRQAVWTTSLSEDILKDFVQNVKAKRLIVIMDACYSNGAYKQIAGFLPPGGKSLGADEDEGFGMSRQYMGKRLLGSKDLFVEDTPHRPGRTASRSKNIHSEKEWGKVLISASDAGERSWESDTLKNGFFTRYFVNGLQQHNGRIKDSFTYAKPLVRTSVKKEKGEEIEQNPQIVTDRREYNINLTTPAKR